jgi:hypothetical protein
VAIGTGILWSGMSILPVALIFYDGGIGIDSIARGTVPLADLDTNASVITYWVSQSDGWHVVTTVDIVLNSDSDAEGHAIVRFSAVLLPGQSQLISIPVAIGEQQKMLRIRRVGDRIEVVRTPGSST